MLGLLAPSAALAQGAAPFAPEHDRGANAGSASSAPPEAPTVVPPRLDHFVQADYPAEARTAGIQGSVLLLLTVEADGHVSDASVVEPVGNGFDEAAVAAARQFTFTPGSVNGTPTTLRIRYRYRFTLQVASAAPTGPVAVVRGVVRNAANEPLANATVHLHPDAGTDRDVVTDATGTFRFELDAPGLSVVTVTREGYREFHSEEQVAAHDDLQVVYRVSAASSGAPSSGPPEDANEQGVTVRGTRPSREVTRTELDRAEINRIPGTGGDALRAIQNLPGLARPSFLSGALIVRGSAPADTQVFLDGTELPLLYHFGGLSSVIQTEMLDRIEFYPGNFSSQFGRAMGGVVDVGLRSPRRQGCHAVANLNAIDVSAFAECALTPNLSLAIAARRSWVDAILGAVLSSSSSINFTAAPVYWDYQAVLEWHPDAHNRIRLSLFGDDDTLAILFRDPNDAAPTLAGQFNVATRFHIAQLSWVSELGPHTRSTAMVSAGWTQLAFSGGGSFDFTLNTVPINARYELTHAFNSYVRMNWGLDVITSPTSVNFSAVFSGGTAGGSTGGATAVAANITGLAYRPATYLEAEVTPVHGLRLVPGMRLDWFDDIHSAILQPRASFRWEAWEHFAFKGGVGLYAQPPQFQQSTAAMNTLLPGQSIGNPNLAPQRAMHYALGLEYQFPAVRGAAWLSNVSVSLEGFYKSLDHLVVTTPQVEQFQGAPPYLSTGTGQVYGMELLLRHRPNRHFFGWVAYTLMRATRTDAPGLPEHLYTYDQTHILTVLGSYTIGWGFEVGLRFRYVTGNLITPIAGSFYNTDTMQYVPVNGPTNSQRLGDFNQLDLRIDKTFHIRGGSFGIFLEVLNVYNQGNPEGYQYNYNYTQRSAINGLPIFPNLGIRGEL